MMHDVAFVMNKGNMSYFDVLKLPLYVFLSLRKNLWILDMESTQEGQEYLAKQQRLMQTDADLSAIRQFAKLHGAYKSQKSGGD